MAIASHSQLEIDVHLIGKSRHPGQNVGELVLLLIAGSLAHCLGQFPDFLGEPGNGRWNTPLGVAFAVRCSDDGLQFSESHTDTVNQRRSR